MKKTTVAVIGCGAIARNVHIPAYTKNPHVKIKYLVDINRKRAEELAKQYGIPKTSSNYEDVLADREVDAVSVCTPNNTHAPISIAFLESGKSVLCEKPAALNYDLVRKMKQAADNSGKILNIGVHNRFDTTVNKIKEFIDAGKLGDIYHIYCSFRAHRSIPGLGGQFTTKNISGGGVLIDWGVHFLDIIFYCIGSPDILTVSGKTYSKLGRDIKDYAYIDMWAGPPDFNGIYDVEDFVTGFIRTSGPGISLNGAWAQNINESPMYIEFLGDKGGIKFKYGGDIKKYSSEDGVLYETSPSFRKVDSHSKIIDSFIASVMNNQKDRANIDYVMLSSEVIEAIYNSDDTGKEITL